MIYRVCITGTESTGKSTLVEKLAIHYKTIFVPDYSRYYIDQLQHAYNQMDVLEIARGIIEQEDNAIRNANKILFSDNDLVNIKIWLQHYKWEVPDWLNEQILKRKSDMYLFCDIDLPWIADSQRTNFNNREELFATFITELTAINANLKFVSGNLSERTEVATAHVDTFLHSILAA